jgi:hypothetical protein
MTYAGSHDWSKKCKQYSGHYKWDGALWAVDFRAYDMEDAQARCRQFGNVEFAGETVAIIPCSEMSRPILGIFVRLACWARNLFVERA